MQLQSADDVAVAMEGCLGTRVARLQRTVGRRFDQALRPLGLSMAQLELLAWLKGQDAPVRPSELAGIMAVERSTMSRNLAVLERQGWVATVTASSTGRSMAVALTAAGSEKLREAGQTWAVVQRETETLLGPDAAATIKGWVAAVRGQSGPFSD